MLITHWLEGPDAFPMAHFKAKYNKETVGDFKKYDHMADLAVHPSEKGAVESETSQLRLKWGGWPAPSLLIQ